MFLFWVVSCLIDNLSIVDVAYCFSQLLIGILLFFYYDVYNFKQAWVLALLAVQTLRLGLYLLFSRILKKKRDQRYEAMMERRNSKFLFGFIQF